MKDAENSQLKRSLGVTSIVLMVVATAAPLTVMVASSPLMIIYGNGVAAPVDALVAAVIMFLFTVGFISMSKFIKNSGAFYAYIQKGLGRSVGLGSATLAVLSYAIILIALEAFIGHTLSEAIKDLSGVNLPWWLYSLATIGVIAYLGHRDIELSSKFLGIALILEIAIVIIVDMAVFYDKGATGMEMAAFKPSNFFEGAPGLGVLFAIFSFIGFESTVIYRDEARDPEKTIPRATYLAVFIVGAFYVISLWCAVSAIGKDNIASYSDLHGADLYLALTKSYLGTVMFDIMHVLLITSLFACALSLHNIVVRYKFTLSRYGVLNNRLSKVHTKHGSPHVSSLVLTIFATITLALLVIVNADPVAHIYTLGAMAGTLGYMVILSLTCLSVVVFFAKQKSADKKLWSTFLAPILGLVGILGCLWIAISNLPDLLGGDHPTTSSMIVLFLLLFTFVFGFSSAQVLKKRQFERYESLRELA